MLLIRGVASSTPTISPTIATAPGATTTTESSASTETAAAAATVDTRDVGALGGDLDVATFEDAFVQHEGLGHEAWFCEFDICIPRIALLATGP